MNYFVRLLNLIDNLPSGGGRCTNVNMLSHDSEEMSVCSCHGETKEEYAREFPKHTQSLRLHQQRLTYV
jgi:hypothetical protein